MESSQGVSERIYHVLVKGRRSDKEALSSELAGLDETELVRLRRRILAAGAVSRELADRAPPFGASRDTNQTAAIGA